MAGKKNDRAREKEINRKFELQQRRLNRKWTRNAVGGIILLVIIIAALRFTPYRDLPMDIFEAAKDFVSGLTSGGAAPVEPDPQYW